MITTALAMLSNCAASTRNTTTNATPNTIYISVWLSLSVAASPVKMIPIPSGSTLSAIAVRRVIATLRSIPSFRFACADTASDPPCRSSVDWLTTGTSSAAADRGT